MMTTLNLHLTLLSETTFGRGDGVVGLVDQEITHDPVTGLPFLRGRTLKGLLVEECANILNSVQAMKSPHEQKLHEAARFLFGDPGSHLHDDARMRVGMAQLPDELRDAVETAVTTKKWMKEDVLDSLTAIRRQTAVNNTTGIPQTGSLRAMRVLLRKTELVARLEFTQKPDETALALLSACAASLHRAGTGRNRGRGRMRVVLENEETMANHLAHFEQMVGGTTA